MVKRGKIAAVTSNAHLEPGQAILDLLHCCHLICTLSVYQIIPWYYHHGVAMIPKKVIVQCTKTIIIGLSKVHPIWQE